jgi:carboxymethylenebutenolidase
MPSQPLQDVTSEGLRARLALAEPPGSAGVLVLPAVSGLAGNIGKLLAGLAGAGLNALAWDPFSAHPADIALADKQKITETEQRDELAQREHSHWVDYLREERGLETVGVLGFCMGGRMSVLLAAADRRIASCVAYYPTLRDPQPANVLDPVPRAAKIACPVQIHYPGKDHLTSQASFGRLRTALEARTAAATAIYFHPQATHGFLSRAGEAGHPDAAAGALSWPATLAFLQATLG